MVVMISLICGDDMKNDNDDDDDVSPQDLEQQLLLELRDPVGAMAVHRQLVEVGYPGWCDG